MENTSAELYEKAGRVTTTCALCGTQFEHQKSRKREFCSKSCASKKHRQERTLPVREKTGIDQPCAICGKVFYRKQWQIKDEIGFCCSRECNLAWQSRNSVMRACEWCGKQMKMSPFRAGRQRFCSRACFVEGSSQTAIDRWHNGRRVRKNDVGYLLVFEPEHPKSYKDGWMPEHRLIAEQSIGRLLESEEHVHHINAVRDDNRPENLMVVSASEHQNITNAAMMKLRREEQAELAEYRKRYGPLQQE